jgi:Arm DNA-binding domain
MLSSTEGVTDRARSLFAALSLEPFAHNPLNETACCPAIGRAKLVYQGLKLIGKNWIFSYRHAGKARRMKLGTAPLLVHADARRTAQHFAGLVAIGRDPCAERKAARKLVLASLARSATRSKRLQPPNLKHARARTHAGRLSARLPGNVRLRNKPGEMLRRRHFGRLHVPARCDRGPIPCLTKSSSHFAITL